MWYLARDLVLGENAHPIPEIPDRGGRPGADGREMPQIPPPHEMLIKQLMNVLMIEIRAERGFEFNVDLMRDPEAFADRRADADRAADIVDQIRQDEAIARGLSAAVHLRTAPAATSRPTAGVVEGKTFIDPVWAKIVAWNADEVPRIQRETTRALIGACVKGLPDSAAFLARFDALADALEPA